MCPPTLTRLLLALTLVFAGCAGYQRYEPLTVPVAAEARVRTAAIRELATLEGWHLVGTPGRRGRIEAISSDSGTRREFIRIDSSRDSLRITVRTELRDGDGDWLGSDIVCPSYSYARETEVAERLARLVRVHGGEER
ncbi:MAG: hypothetical protein R3A48_23570 [Polyangiales bacterium]